MVPNGITCLKGEKNCLLTHKNIKDSCQSMEKYLIRKSYSKDAENFLLDLKRKNFAEDEKYIEKIKSVSYMLEKELWLK